MARKVDKIEPKVKIGRKCIVCGSVFVLSHPNAPNRMCEDCENVLIWLINERRSDYEKQ